MSANVARLVPRTPNPATEAALADLIDFGTSIARVAAELAQVERHAVAALAAAAAATARRTATPAASLADAIEAGHQAEITDATRGAVAGRLALITEAFDKAARAVRRTAALQARLADPRALSGPVRDPDDRRSAAPPPRPATGREPGEGADRPETGDELAGLTDEQVLRSVHRDLSEAASGLDLHALPAAAAAAASPAHPPGTGRGAGPPPRDPPPPDPALRDRNGPVSGARDPLPAPDT